MGRDSRVVIDAETSKVSMTPARLIALIVGTIAAASFISEALSASASKQDLEEALQVHDRHPHTPTEERLQALEAADAQQNEALGELKPLPDTVRRIDSKIDVLIFKELEASQSSPRQRNAVRRAAKKARQAAERRGEEDPLAGMDGL